jgi:hypothetical protein
MDLDRGALSVTTTRVVVGGHAQDSDNTRSQPAAATCARSGALAEQRHRQDQERAAFGTGYGDTELVFT